MGQYLLKSNQTLQKAYKDSLETIQTVHTPTKSKKPNSNSSKYSHNHSNASMDDDYIEFLESCNVELKNELKQLEIKNMHQTRLISKLEEDLKHLSNQFQDSNESFCCSCNSTPIRKSKTRTISDELILSHDSLVFNDSHDSIDDAHVIKLEEENSKLKECIDKLENQVKEYHQMKLDYTNLLNERNEIQNPKDIQQHNKSNKRFNSSLYKTHSNTTHVNHFKATHQNRKVLLPEPLVKNPNMKSFMVEFINYMYDLLSQ